MCSGESGDRGVSWARAAPAAESGSGKGFPRSDAAGERTLLAGSCTDGEMIVSEMRL
jgi:hypothetical protein